MNYSNSRVLFVHFLRTVQKPAHLTLHGNLALLQCVSSNCTGCKKTKQQHLNDRALHRKPGTQVWLQPVGPKFQSSDAATSPSPHLIKQSDSLHPFKEAAVFSLKIKVSIYVKNSCKRQEKQEGNFRPSKCIAGNKRSTDSLEASYSKPIFSQHQLEQHTQEKHPAQVLTPH